MCHNLIFYLWQRLRNNWFRYRNLWPHSKQSVTGFLSLGGPVKDYWAELYQKHTPLSLYDIRTHQIIFSELISRRSTYPSKPKIHCARRFSFSFLPARMGHSSLSDRSHKEITIKAKVWLSFPLEQDEHESQMFSTFYLGGRTGGDFLSYLIPSMKGLYFICTGSTERQRRFFSCHYMRATKCCFLTHSASYPLLDGEQGSTKKHHWVSP